MQKSWLSGSLLSVFMLLLSIGVQGQKQVAGGMVFDLGQPPLHILLPGRPDPMETQIQPSMLEIMQAYYAYSYASANHHLVVMLMQTSFVHTAPSGINLVADQTKSDLESHGAGDVTFSTSNFVLENKKGLRQKGTLTIEGDTMDFVSTIVSDGSNVWKVIVCTLKKDATAVKAGKAVLASMTFK